MRFTRLAFVLLFILLAIGLLDAGIRLWDFTHSTSIQVDSPAQTRLAGVWQIAGLLLLGVLIIERLIYQIFLKNGSMSVHVQRDIAKTLPVNSFSRVSLSVSIRPTTTDFSPNKKHTYESKRSKVKTSLDSDGLKNQVSMFWNKQWRLKILDHYPENCLTQPLQLNNQEVDSSGTDSVHPSIKISCGQTVRFDYQIKPFQRGDLYINYCEIWITSFFGLLSKRFYIDAQSQSRVYPNFRSISHYVLLATEQRTRQLGIRQRQRRGDGLDFHQLREYREGDSLRQIDWRSTSRLRKLIAKEYQQERDQNILFLLDSGRRMRTKDDDLSHFDQALNATLLVSHIALKQGDAVGLQVFGGNDIFLPPAKGPATVSRMLNQVYGLHANHHASDLVRAADSLVKRFKKRSLVVLISNIRSEDQAELMLACRLLKKHHLVLVANLREKALDDILELPITDTQDALTYAQTNHYLVERKTLQQKLYHGGVINVDTLPSHLAINMANQYFDVKRSGRL